MTGHGFLNWKLKQLGLVDSDRCHYGGIEDAEHVLKVCTSYEDIRTEFLRNIECGSIENVDWVLVATDKRFYGALSEYAERAFIRRSQERGV